MAIRVLKDVNIWSDNKGDILNLLEDNLVECRSVDKETLHKEMKEPLEKMDEYADCLIDFDIKVIHEYQFAFFDEHASELTTLINGLPNRTDSIPEILKRSKSTFLTEYWENFYDKVEAFWRGF